MTIEQQLHDGSRAKEILENEQFNASFDAIEQELLTAWKTSPQRDAEGREKLFQYLTLLGKVKSHLVSTLESGKLAELELTHRQTMYDRARDGIRSLIA